MIPSATPASSRRLGERWRRAKRNKITVMNSAPAIAQRLSAQPDSAPPPSITAAISPTPAPFDTPNRPGSASGLSNRACIIVPLRASAAPTSTTARVRGIRICQMNNSPCGPNHACGPIHCSPAQRLNPSASTSATSSKSTLRRSERYC
ncbi:hypothetical protein D3C75_465960 [compost metagenome]